MSLPKFADGGLFWQDLGRSSRNDIRKDRIASGACVVVAVTARFAAGGAASGSIEVLSSGKVPMNPLRTPISSYPESKAQHSRR